MRRAHSFRKKKNNLSFGLTKMTLLAFFNLVLPKIHFGNSKMNGKSKVFEDKHQDLC